MDTKTCLIEDMPMQSIIDYSEFNNDILSKNIIIRRTEEVCISITLDQVIKCMNNLLKEKILLNYERKTLDLLKSLINIKIKNKCRFTKIKNEDFIKFARYAFEANIERASWVQDKIIENNLKKEYNENISKILFILNQNILLLKKIKEINPESEEEFIREIKKVREIGPKIQKNILGTYLSLGEQLNEENIVDEIFNDTLECISKCYPLE
ncbi:MAG: hypothetical protein PHD81_02055 [Candidatus Nanoarchaeia archaeon]|nr:hypothetical protein [Candidatus Nanoarchaeia archaeon]MDD5587873.1 hypothetical protein [Candidatus Nanoarchaeia archaeon]